MSDIYHVGTSIKARDDLKSIYMHIAYVLLEPVAAERLYTRTENAIYALDQFPERHRQYDKVPWKSRNLRVMPVGKFIVYYVVDNETKTVTVVRIMYGARDVETELDNTEWPLDLS